MFIKGSHPMLHAAIQEVTIVLSIVLCPPFSTKITGNRMQSNALDFWGQIKAEKTEGKKIQDRELRLLGVIQGV